MTAVATTLRSLLLTATGSVAVLGAVLAIRAIPAGFAGMTLDMPPGGTPGTTHTGVNGAPASTAPLAPPTIQLSPPAPSPAPGDRRPRNGWESRGGWEPRDR
ncbi:hypothetical protein [Streptosporangium subroseum]|uniref:hypothetical protein n=1 Tax=Streptosporangium subroseum TaxID=106412 RepID=UPI00308B05E6|nr:hypothetical protein OHB15_37930 [Streptosporangium subroseum]